MTDFWTGRSVIQPRQLQNLDKEMREIQTNKKTHKPKNPTQTELETQIKNFISGSNFNKNSLRNQRLEHKFTLKNYKELKINLV